MIDYFYDCEFIEDGKSIELISIGIVNSRNEEYYAVNADICDRETYQKIVRHKWLMENVIPHLPITECNKETFKLNVESPLVKPKPFIAQEVRQFFTKHNEPIRLWAYYGSYDHVVVSWLWGPMINRPNGIPMFTMDLMQWAAHLGMDDSMFPKQTGTVHNALEDAKWNFEVAKFLRKAELALKFSVTPWM